MGQRSIPKKRWNEITSIVESEWSDFEIEASGKHIQVTFRESVSGTSRKTFASFTPSDGRADLNFRSDVRKIVRELKELRKEKQNG